MLYTTGTFKLKVVPDAAGYMRPATGDAVTLPCAVDDILTCEDSEEHPGVVMIDSLHSVQLFFRRKRLFQAFLFVVLWGIAYASIWAFACKALTVGVVWTNYIRPSLFAVLAIIYTPQVLHPVVHDGKGHWINLRTGKTNLNGSSILH